MRESNFLTEAQYEEARARPLVTQDAPRRAQYADADFFVEEARRLAIRRFRAGAVNRRGY